MTACETCGGDRWVETDAGAIRCPDCTSDHGLRARSTDPSTSVEAGATVEAREGTTATVTRGTQKHRLLEDMRLWQNPEIDRRRCERAGLAPHNGAWHRVTDLVDAGYATVTDENGYDLLTGKRVRRTTITALGHRALDLIDAGKQRVKL